MKLLFLIGLAAAWWGWRSARRGQARHGDLAAAIVAIVALALFAKGEAVPALIAGGGVAGWFWWRRREAASDLAMSPREARRVLDLPDGADARAVRDAHRRLIARVHPDAGGSLELARRVNAARDALLARSGAET